MGPHAMDRALAVSHWPLEVQMGQPTPAVGGTVSTPVSY